VTVKDAPAPLVEIKVEQASRRLTRGAGGGHATPQKQINQKTEKAVEQTRVSWLSCRMPTVKRHNSVTHHTATKFRLRSGCPFTSRCVYCVLLGCYLVEQSIHAVRNRQVARS